MSAEPSFGSPSTGDRNPLTDPRPGDWFGGRNLQGQDREVRIDFVDVVADETQVRCAAFLPGSDEAFSLFSMNLHDFRAAAVRQGARVLWRAEDGTVEAARG
jgi:hypothetical protein